MSSRAVLLPGFLFASIARAAEVGAGGTASAVVPLNTGVPELGTSALQMLFGLLLVLGLLVAVLWLMKRLAAPRGPVAGLMRVVAGVAVGSRERVVILELGNSWLVLGVAPGQVTTLAEIPRQELPAGGGANGKDFSAWLKQIVDRRDPN